MLLLCGLFFWILSCSWMLEILSPFQNDSSKQTKPDCHLFLSKGQISVGMVLISIEMNMMSDNEYMASDALQKTYRREKCKKYIQKYRKKLSNVHFSCSSCVRHNHKERKIVFGELIFGNEGQAQCQIYSWKLNPSFFPNKKRKESGETYNVVDV